MPISPFTAAINQICDEKGLSKEVVLETIEAAVAAAYRKDYGRPTQNIKAKFDPETGQAKIWQVFEVTEEVEDAENQKTVKEAKKLKKTAKLGEQVEIPLKPQNEFGRIAAQTAKQVIIQRIREAEREMLYQEFKKQENKILNGVVQQIEGSAVIVDLGKLNGLMLPSEQIPQEKYYSGERLKVFILGVEETSRGPQVLISRANPELIKGLFELEVPEISAGTVKIEGIAREAGSRSKVAVSSLKEGLDPVGSCVGQRGTRIQAVLAEIGDEKIDIVLFDKDDALYISNALSPSKVQEVKLHKKERKATVFVILDQLSLAIGKGGQNVRLASKLTGWSINIEKAPEAEVKKAPAEKQTEKTKAKKEAVKTTSKTPKKKTKKAAKKVQK
ncbi:MAG TPA: transcription termination factor NusA [Patescibacteria group bacterium]|nr:transcription termination factor NusA [Patescibacteria group bacterium]